MESIPETKIRMMNGNYYLVKESVEKVREQAEIFLSRCMHGGKKEREED